MSYILYKMNFSQYFQEWLFGENGYYKQDKDIGKSGDFYTAVSVSSFFGGTIGKKICDIISDKKLPKDTTIIEIGANSGYMMADMIQFIYTIEPSLIDSLKFVLTEQNSFIINKQKRYLEKSFANKINIQYVSNIKDISCSSAFVVANELFDTFACEIIHTEMSNNIKKAVVQNDKISFENCTKDDKYIQDIAKKYNIKKGEISLGFENFANILSQNIDKIEFITFDYGEYYPRGDISCRVYNSHKVLPLFDEKLILKDHYKNSDITYDISFKHLIDSFLSCGFTKVAYSTQLKALVDFGIISLLDILRKNSDQKTYTKYNNQIKLLLDPAGMGERFKMVHFAKGRL